MHRNSKQVLLKYNTVERKTTEDDALMFKIKTLIRWFFLTALLFFPFMFYVPLYFDDGVSRKSVDVPPYVMDALVESFFLPFTEGLQVIRKIVDMGTMEFYLELYTQPGFLQLLRMVIYGWGLNTSRSVPLYVIPDNDTALIVGTNLCSEPLLLLIVVCSAANNTLERATIRETWGNFSSPDYKLAFLLGTTDNITLQETIEEEASIHNDVIQENFIDSYNNLTLKSVMLLKFVKNHCKQIEYIFKSDDDMFTYIPNLLALIKLLEEKNLKNILIGKLICGAKPILEVNSKWYAPRYMYHEKVYPHYLSGTGYLMHRKTAIQLYEAALEIPYLHLEDVFITGLCARKAKIRPRHHSGFSYLTRPLDPCLYLLNQNVITSHRVTLEHMRQLWAAFNNGTTCSKAKSPILAKLDFLKAPLGKKNRCF